MFLRKNDQIEKNWNSFAEAPPEKQSPPYWSDFQQLFSPNLFLKNRPPSNLKTGGTENEA